MTLTEKTIEELISISFAKNPDPRQQHFFRESLRNLVRLAKAEQMLEMRTDVTKARQRVGNTIPLHATR